MEKTRKPNATRTPPVPTDSHAEIEDWTRRVMPDLQPIVKRLDASIRETIPGLRYAVKWKRAYYGLPELGWIIEMVAYDVSVNVVFFGGADFDPPPPLGDTERTRYVEGEDAGGGAGTGDARRGSSRRGACRVGDEGRRLALRATAQAGASAVPEASRRLAAVTHRLILDVSSMMYRAYFAMGDSVHAPDGRTMGALHGYLDMVGAAREVAAARRGRARVRPRLASRRSHRPLPPVQGDPSGRPRGPAGAVRAAAGDPGAHRHAAGAVPGLGGRGRHRRVLRGRRRGATAWRRSPATGT